MRDYSKFKPDEIQVWIDNYSNSDQLSGKMTSLLSTAEIQRANAFHFKEDQKRYVHAHTLLRLILGKYTGIQPQDIDYKMGTYGKPYLMTENPIYFNLSHTKEMIAVAVSPENNIGIDIEKQAYIADLDSVAQQFMSKAEFDEMSYLEANSKKDYFYQCWVRKEALVKASGRGIDDHLRALSVMDGCNPDEARTISTLFEETPNTWWLKTFEITPDHLGAVCIESSDAQTACSIRLRYDSALEYYYSGNKTIEYPSF
jgi:4'-phosphopantetheinyl transferase